MTHKFTGSDVASIAGDLMNITSAELANRTIDPNDREQLADDIRSLAASALSQTRNNRKGIVGRIFSRLRRPRR